MKRLSKKILGASLGSCVHVTGVYRFLQLAEQFGYQSVFLGPAVSIEDLMLAVEKERPQKIMVGYRLYEEAGRALFRKLKEALEEKNLRSKMTVMLSCTPALREVAQEADIFDFIFTGEESFDDIVSSLQEVEKGLTEKGYPQTLPERILWKRPFPILRHHFGLPTVGETVQGVAQISEAKVLDVISLGPDQNA